MSNKLGYKLAEIGEIPKEWQVIRLEEVCEKVTDGTHKTPKYVEKGVPFLSTRNIVPFTKGFDFSKYEKYIAVNEHTELIKRCKPEKGDVLISKCGTIGRTKLIDVDYEFSIFVGLALLKLKKTLVSGEYLEQLLNHEPFRIRMEVASPGSTRKTLTINAIENLKIPLSPLPEQQKIASVLCCVDEAIKQTDEIIQKSRELKKGLMQQLLTKGIGHTKFKQTEIEEIPEEWKVVELKTVCPSIVGGVAIETIDFLDHGFPVLSKGDIKEFGQLLFDKKQKKYVNEDFATRFPHQIAQHGDIVIAMRDLSTEMSFLGLAARITDNCQYLVAQGVGIVKVDENLAIPDFITNLSNTTQYRKFIRKRGIGSTQVHLRAKELLSFKFGLPSLLEQQKIVFILSAVDEKIEREKQRKEQLEKLKKGLMQDLLTGRVRVKVD